jgi:hypothetical protein
MQQARGAVESALANSHRAAPIRATKMNVPPQGLFVDFLFVDNSGKIDSGKTAILLVIASEAKQSRKAVLITGLLRR